MHQSTLVRPKQRPIHPKAFIRQFFYSAWIIYALAFIPAEALATSSGKTGVSTSGCTCHSGGTAPAVAFSGAPSGSVSPGTTVLLKVLVTHKAAGQTYAGFDVSATGGSLTAVNGDTTVKAASSEVTHTAPKVNVGGVTEFQFNWTAPATAGTYTLRGVGNSVNKNGGTSGDMWAAASNLTIQVEAPCPDADKDGATDLSCGGTDCNDANASINLAAQEVCDGIDNDCDALTDDSDPSVTGQKTYYQDADGDTYGSSLTTTRKCSSTPPQGYVANNQDCNDALFAVNPGAAEVCNAMDDDCDQKIDEADPSLQGASTFFPDADGDTFGATSGSILSCTKPSGYVSSSTDCNDQNPSVNPNAQELCNSIDDDCDQKIDDADGSVQGQHIYYTDQDGDSFGNPNSPISTCAASAPNGFVPDHTDCNDANAAVKPTAIESCNTIDDDCDGLTDDKDPNVSGQTIYYADSDTDSFGNSSSSTKTCATQPPIGYVDNSTDCDDTNRKINPNAQEICDTLDNDCDTKIDDSDSSISGQNTYYADTDSDGFGNSSALIQTCSSTPPAGYSVEAGDCNDSNSSIKPSGTEICGDGTDQDCSGQDLSCSTVDGDQDGFTPIQGDCNDASPSIHPGAVEICGDSIDQDCLLGDLSCDDVDNDLDTFTENEGDCDDTDFDINPDAVDIPYDELDQDCDDIILMDVDDDGADGGEGGPDCNDTNPDIRPGKADLCGDGIDSNCDGFDEVCPTPTPTPEPVTPTQAPTPTATPSPTATLSPEVSPTASPTMSPPPDGTHAPSPSPETTPTESPTPAGPPEATPSTAPSPAGVTETPAAPETEVPVSMTPDDNTSGSCACTQQTPEPTSGSLPTVAGLLLSACLLGMRRSRRPGR